MKNVGIKLAAIAAIAYCGFVAVQLFYLQKPEETEPIESIKATAQDALQNEDYELAIEKFTLALARNPNDSESHGNLGLALMHVGHTEAAIPEFEECLLLDPGRLDIAKQLGMLQFKFDRLKEAKQNLEAVVSERPDDAEALQWLFTINNGLDLQVDNLPVVTRLAELHPDDLQYVYAQIMIHYQSDQLDDALRIFETLPADEQAKVKARYLLGSIRYKQNDFPRAIELLEQVVRDEPAHDEATKLLQVVRTKAEQTRNQKQQIAEIESAIAANPDDAEAHFKHGLTLTQMGRADEATAAFSECLSRVDPKDVEAVKRMGKRFFSLKRLEMAEQCLALVAGDSDDIGVYELMVAINTERKQPLENLPILKKMASLKPDETKYVVWQLGICLENGKPKEALELMLGMPPEWQDQVRNQYILGVTYYQLKEFSKAIELLEKVVSAEPSNADAKKILELCRSELKQ